MLTKKMTRRFKDENCVGCNFALKKALKTGEPHCKHKGDISQKNGICLQRKTKCLSDT